MWLSTPIKNLNDFSKVTQQIDKRGGTWINAGNRLFELPVFQVILPTHTHFQSPFFFCKLYSSPGNKTGYGRKKQLIPYTMHRAGKSAEPTSG